MRISKELIWMAALLMFFCGAASAAEKGMNPAGQAFVKAIKANDLEAVVALYAPDAVLFPPDAMAAHGTEEIRKSYSGLLNTFTVQDLTVSDAWHEVHGDISIGWGLFTFTLKPKTGGDAVVMNGRFTDFSTKVGGKWLYTADHASVPFAPPPQSGTTH